MLPERFWVKVKRTKGCWIWTGCLSKKGRYGLFHLNRRTQRAHRLVYEDLKGKTGLGVLHKCDTTYCVRPDHLFTGTPRENTQDMIAKGRSWRCGTSRRGEENPSAKLGAEEVMAIRKLWQKRGDLTRLARNYGVSLSQVWRIVHKESWSHV
jgi:hypothetical protein